MEKLLSSFVVADIHVESVIEKYVEIDAYSQGRHPKYVLGVSARNMGKNDVWIAATAAALNIPLLTTDRDFSHLDGVLVKTKFVPV